MAMSIIAVLFMASCVYLVDSLRLAMMRKSR